LRFHKRAPKHGSQAPTPPVRACGDRCSPARFEKTVHSNWGLLVTCHVWFLARGPRVCAQRYTFSQQLHHRWRDVCKWFDSWNVPRMGRRGGSHLQGNLRHRSIASLRRRCFPPTDVNSARRYMFSLIDRAQACLDACLPGKRAAVDPWFLKKKSARRFAPWS